MEKILGRGSFGEVWGGLQVRTGQRVALKVILRGGLDSHEVEKIRQVAEHPHVVTLLDADLEHQPPFFVMPWLAGSLDDLPGPPTPGQAVTWLDEVCDGLQFTHDQGLIHCDLKPSNLLLDQQNRTRIVDFGQSHSSAGKGGLGTLGYLAPEQASGDPPTVASDIYALAATFYRLLGGQYPRIQWDSLKTLSEKSSTVVLPDYVRLLRQTPLVPLRQLNPKVDADLAAILEKCLELDPARRTPSARQISEDLEHRRHGDPLLCRRPWTLGYRLGRLVKRPAVLLTLLFVLALLAILIASSQNLRRVNREANDRLVRLMIERAASACKQGDVNADLLWSAAALQLDPGNAELRTRVRAPAPWQPVSTVRLDEGMTFLRTSPDGKLVTGRGGGQVYALADGRKVHSQPALVDNCHFSADSAWLWTLSRDRIAAIDTRSWAIRKEWTFLGEKLQIAPGAGAQLLVLHKDGRVSWLEPEKPVALATRQLAHGAGNWEPGLNPWLSWRSNHRLDLFDVRGNEAPGHLLDSTDITQTASDDGKWILKVDHGSVSLRATSNWALEEGPWNSLRNVRAGYLAPGSQILLRLQDGPKQEFRVYRIRDHRLVLTVPKGSGHPFFAPDGRQMYLQVDPGRVRSYSTENGCCLQDVAIQASASFGVVGPDPTRVIFQDLDSKSLAIFQPPQSQVARRVRVGASTTLLYDVPAGLLLGQARQLQMLSGEHLKKVSDLAGEPFWLEVGGHFATVLGEKESFLMDLDTATVLGRYPDQFAFISPHGSWFGFLNRGKPGVWLSRTDSVQPRKLEITAPVNSMAFSPDEQQVALLEQSEHFDTPAHLHLADLNRRRLTRSLTLGPATMQVFWESSQRLITSGYPDKIQAYQLPGGEPLRSVLSGTGEARMILASPDRRSAALRPGRGQTLDILDLHNVRYPYPALEVAETAEGLGCMAFSQDSTWLATADTTGLVRVWSLASGWPLTGWIATGGPAKALAFSRDKRWLICAVDEELLYYDLGQDLDSPAQIQQRVERETGYRLDPDRGTLSTIETHNLR